jgi:hypothetical protein
MIGSTFNFLLLLVSVLLFATQIERAEGIRDNDSEADEYVRQVIEEDQDHYYDEYHADESVYQDSYNTNNGEDGGNKEEEEIIDEEQRRRNEEERVSREAANRLAEKREREFQTELDRMDKEEKKKALKQKKIDGRRVQSVLKAAKHDNLYGILGIRNWKIFLPPREINIASLIKFTIPGIIIKETSERDIRKQFRKRAMQIHPDKNKDGRALEAFIVVENAAAILSDKQQRNIYDEENKLYRSNRLQANQRLMTTTILSAWNAIRRVVKILKTFLGPFFVPVSIVLAMII